MEIIMKDLVFTTILVICMVSFAQAAPTFDFENAILGSGGSESIQINNERASEYMSSIYGVTTVTGGAVWSNDQYGQDWIDNDGQWLRTFGSTHETPGYMQVSFDDPILGASGSGYVFAATPAADFVILAFDNNYGDRFNPNPNALVDAFIIDYGTTWWGDDRGDLMVVPFDRTFDSPVSLLVFSDGGYFDIGVDDLTVEPFNAVQTPAPGAIILGSIGVAIVGWLRRRRTI